MSKRKWTNVKAQEDRIIAMRTEGSTVQEIADALGLEKRQIETWVTRHNREQKRQAAGIPSRPKGRPHKEVPTADEDEKHELERLRMENKLLRDFLQLMGRK